MDTEDTSDVEKKKRLEKNEEYKQYIENKGRRIVKKPTFPGQASTNNETRLKMMQAFAKTTVLARKNELGLILDLISSCLDVDPKKRPTINGLLHSPLFQMDNYELTKAVRFS